VTATRPTPLATSLELDEIRPNVFRSRNAHLLASADARGDQPSRAQDRRRVFGGQLLAQALAAGIRSAVPDRAVHSLHAYFVAGADGGRPIDYHVERVRDGRAVSNRRVVGRQGDREVVAVQLSFHRESVGLEHQDRPLGDIAHEELSIASGEEAHVWSGVELKFGPVDVGSSPSRTVHRQVWMRVVEPLGDDPSVHRCALAYASDLTLIRTALLPHGADAEGGRIRMDSLDHTIWYHQDARVDDWLLLESFSPVAAGSRALAWGSVFTGGGALVATVAQEGMLRLLTTG
jgi:acyl-CoA thioesterase-2